ncbi:MAG: diphthine--ammonia ligase [Conexivisphaerales archaeon]
MQKIVHSWSTGKDSSYSLYRILQQKEFYPAYLLTTITKDYERVSMHGIRKELVIKQAEAIGIPLDIAYISKNSTNTEYEAVMKEKLLQYKAQQINKVSFGDIFLTDIREYRETRLKELDMECIFPIWGLNTHELSREIISSGFRAIVCTVDPRRVPRELVGKQYDEEFLRSLPEEVDPCGENGEFHTFVYDGPIFDKPLKVEVRDSVLKDSFYFSDIVPV